MLSWVCMLVIGSEGFCFSPHTLSHNNRMYFFLIRVNAHKKTPQMNAFIIAAVAFSLWAGFDLNENECFGLLKLTIA